MQDSQTENKRCSACGEEKPATLEYFHKKKGGLQPACKECRNKQETERHYKNRDTILKRKKEYYRKNEVHARQKQQENYWKNPEKERESAKKRYYKNWERNNKLKRLYRAENRDRLLEYYKEWRENNKDKHNEGCRKYKRRQRATNPTFVISNRVNRAVNRSLRDGKRGEPWARLLGYNADDLKRHLESLFTEGMSWGEFLEGNIHIDHIKPISAFDFQSVKEPQFKACWSLKNLQPLWAIDNIRKSNHYVEQT